jgi:hypothetical protein
MSSASGRPVLAIETLRWLYDGRVNRDRGDPVQRNAAPEHAAMLCSMTTLGRRWSRPRIAVGHPRIITVSIEKMRGREYQPVILITRLRRYVPNQQPK